MTQVFKVLPILLLTISCGGDSRGGRAVIQNKGSDTLVNVAQAWAENYGVVNPSVAVAVSGGGSGTGIRAMINGTVDIANASRAMRESELEEARARGDMTQRETRDMVSIHVQDRAQEGELISLLILTKCY